MANSLNKTKLEKSNNVHTRLKNAHYYAGMYGNDNNQHHLDLFEYHNTIIKRQKQTGKILEQKEKRKILLGIKKRK